LNQKASDGFKKLNHYLNRYFIDSSKIKTLSLEDYSYLTQCLQYYILKNSIAIHRSKYPRNMGTLLWQMNDCWPVASWSITDYSRAPKAAWYAVKEAYRDNVMPVKDIVRPRDLKLEKPDFVIMLQGNRIKISSTAPAKYVQLSWEGAGGEFSDNYFDLEPGVSKIISFENKGKTNPPLSNLKIRSLYNVLYK